MKSCKTNLFLSPILMLGLLLGIGCGGGGTDSSNRSTTSSGDGSGVSISGTVEVPSSASVSIGASLSKSVGKSVGKAGDGLGGIKVAKAVGDTLLSNGDVILTNSAGEEVDRGAIVSGSLSGCVVDTSKLKSDKQVFVKAVSGDGKTQLATIVDLADTSSGSKSAGTINVESTIPVNQVLAACGSDASLDNIKACATASGVKIDALFKTFNGVSGTSAGVSDASGVKEAMKSFWRGAYASGKPPTPAEMAAMINGDASVINNYKGFSSTTASFDASAMGDIMKNWVPACKEYYNNDTLYNNYKKLSDSEFQKGGPDYFKNLGNADFVKMKDEPAVYHALMGKYVSDAAAGSTTAFKDFGKPDFARTMAGIGGTIDVADITGVSGKLAAIQSLFNGGTWGSAFNPNSPESFGNMIKAADKPAEFGAWNTDPAAFATKAYSGAYVGIGGAASADTLYVTYINNPTAITGTDAHGCTAATSATDCPTGFTCNTNGNYCISSTLDASNRAYNMPCTTNGQCSSGLCSALFCGGGGLTALKVIGETCSDSANCFSANCSSGSCAAPVVVGAASHHGLYKKTAGQSPTCNINFQIDAPPSATAFFNVQPVDITNPTGNTFFGGGITVTGSSSPFSIASSIISGPATKTGRIRCDGTFGSTTLALSGSRLTGTCALATISGSPAYPSTCTIDHTKQ